MTIEEFMKISGINILLRNDLKELELCWEDDKWVVYSNPSEGYGEYLTKTDNLDNALTILQKGKTL